MFKIYLSKSCLVSKGHKGSLKKKKIYQKIGNILPSENWKNKFLNIFVIASCCCLAAQLCPTLCDPIDCSTPGFPSLSPRLCSNSCPLSQWCNLTISSSVSPFSCPQSFPTWGSFPVSALHIRWLKYWSFIIGPSKEYSGFISFRIDGFDLLGVQGTLKSLLQHHSSKSINSSALRFLYSPTLTSIHDYWKNHSFDTCNVH